MRFVKGAHGSEMIPHVAVWKELLNLIKVRIDLQNQPGCRFAHSLVNWACRILV